MTEEQLLAAWGQMRPYGDARYDPDSKQRYTWPEFDAAFPTMTPEARQEHWDTKMKKVKPG